MSEHSVWAGRLVRLRGMEPADAPVLEAWDADGETQRLAASVQFPLPPEAIRKWIADQGGKATDDCFHFIVCTLDGEPVGAINTHTTNRRTGTFSYGLHVGRAHRGRGYASEAIRLVLRYFFEELRYQKCSVGVYSFNEPSLKLHASLGFTEEGRLRRHIYTRGEYHDEVLFGITREEFRFD